MKITQTFFTSSKDIRQLNGGWLSSKYHLMSWALSSSLLKKHHPDRELELITDNFGKQILIDELKLPYDRVRVELENLDLGEFSDLWLLKKIYAHTLHEEPFLYVDGDVFNFKKFDNNLLQGDLIAQNKEINFKIYSIFIKGVLDNFNHFPDWLVKEYKVNKTYFACNTGITGGQNFKFFKLFYNLVIDFLNKNKDCLKSIPPRILNISLEQFLFYRLSQSQKLEISYLFNTNNFQPNYIGFNNFHETPDKRNFIHLMMDSKMAIHNCEQMSKVLEHNFPKLFQKIANFSIKKNINTISSKRKGNFYRTKNKVKKNMLDNTLTLVKLEKYIQNQCDDAEIVRLFKYEKEIASLYEQYDSLRTKNNQKTTQSQLDKLEKIFSSNQRLELWEITINPLVKRLKVDRKWTQKNGINVFINFREIQEMFKTNSSIDDVLLYYHPEQDLIGEYILLSEKIIFDWLEEYKNIKLSELYKLIDNYCKETFKFYLKDIFYERIRFFISNNILLTNLVANQVNCNKLVPIKY